MPDSFIKWMGGKSQLRNRIIQMIPAHKTYTEPFAGGSWVLFGKPRSHIEVINDIDGDLINLYLVIQNNLEEFILALSGIPISETLFNEFSSNAVDSRYTFPGPENIKKACKLYFVLMNSFNGNIGSIPSFSYSPDRQSPFMKFYRTDWNAISTRLRDIIILSQDYSKVISKFDGPESFFYLDPPYTVATENNQYYRYTFAGSQHKELMVYLSDIKGKFLLSYDNSEEIKELYSMYNIIEIDNELLIFNYELPDPPIYCREGIPTTSKFIKNRSSWKIPNCPYCDSQNVQYVSKRITLQSNKRTWDKCGFICLACDELFK